MELLRRKVNDPKRNFVLIVQENQVDPIRKVDIFIIRGVDANTTVPHTRLAATVPKHLLDSELRKSVALVLSDEY